MTDSRHPRDRNTLPVPLRRRRSRGSAFLLSSSAAAVAALAIMTPSRDLDDFFDRAVAAVPKGADAVPVRSAEARPPASAAEASGFALPEGLRLAADRVFSLVPGERGQAAPSSSPSTERTFGIGDRLKITFYERLDSEDAKWGRASSVMRGIEQRPELSGEYAIQEDGTVSVPLLGAVAAAGRSEPQVQAALAESFEKKFGRKGMVNVLLTERPPVYVMGPVKNPGSFKYAPGMTVLHVVALAGGLDSDRVSSDPWQKVEAVRVIDKRGASLDSLLRLLARQAVLRAERDGSAPKTPPLLVKMVGGVEAANLIDEQSDRRKAVAMARRDRERAAENAVESARQDLRMYSRTDSLDELVRIRQERVDNMRALVEKNVIAKATLGQAQAELSDAEQRRQDAFSQYSMAKQRLAQLENDALRARADLTSEIASELDQVERQIKDNQQEIDTDESVLKTLPVTRTRFADAASKGPAGFGYVIVRQAPGGPIRIEASGMSQLRAGDLVEVVSGAGAAASSQVDRAPSGAIPITAPTRRSPTMERASR